MHFLSFSQKHSCQQVKLLGGLASIMNCHVIATLWRKETMSKQCCPGYPGRRHVRRSAMSQHSRVSWSEFYLGKSRQFPSLPESGTATAHKGTCCCRKATVYLLACLSPHQMNNNDDACLHILCLWGICESLCSWKFSHYTVLTLSILLIACM